MSEQSSVRAASSTGFPLPARVRPVGAVAAFAPGVKVAAKSGGLMGVVRNEIGAVTFDDGATYVVAVFTRSEAPGTDDRAINAAIGEAAAYAITRLREASSN